MVACCVRLDIVPAHVWFYNNNNAHSRERSLKFTVHKSLDCSSWYIVASLQCSACVLTGAGAGRSGHGYLAAHRQKFPLWAAQQSQSRGYFGKYTIFILFLLFIRIKTQKCVVALIIIIANELETFVLLFLFFFVLSFNNCQVIPSSHLHDTYTRLTEWHFCVP